MDVGLKPVIFEMAEILGLAFSIREAMSLLSSWFRFRSITIIPD
jgi:hypothetical protein